MSALVDFDRRFRKEYGTLAGLDEAGRGALAGPVFVGCVSVLESGFGGEELSEVNDSKQLSKGAREELFGHLAGEPGIEIGIGRADNREIDDLGINRATNLAARRALSSLAVRPGLLLLDSGLVVESENESRTLEKGDEKSFHVAAASILAKVGRDRYMWRKAVQFPEYGWKSNVGYGTEQHRKAIKANGLSPLHRQSYTLR